jgi:hypothetical protein
VAVTKQQSKSPARPGPAVSLLAAACRAALYVRSRPGSSNMPAATGSQQRCMPAPAKPQPKSGQILQAFCLSALALPGLLQSAQADDSEDEVDLQYSHYQEARRDIYVNNNQKAPNGYNPITVDSEQASTHFRLSDRVRFAFHYSKDAWGGASPLFTTPAGNAYLATGGTSTGATIRLQAPPSQFFNAQGQALVGQSLSPVLASGGTLSGVIPIDTTPLRSQHALGYASPEIRNQVDFKLGYDWDNAALDAGGGVSQEHDYLSQFGNLTARFDFNQKRTTLNLGGSYTNSATHANIDNSTSAFLGVLPTADMNIPSYRTPMVGTTITGTRQDGAITMALSQLLSKNAVLSAGFGYTRSSGYMSNPYKGVLVFGTDPNWRTDGQVWIAQTCVGPTDQHGNCISQNFNFTLPGANYAPGLQYAANQTLYTENRPLLRNQFTWDTSYRHYLEDFNAAAKLGYNFFHDDWGINAHTFDGEWRQSLFDTWTLTPHVRYYSQTAAFFYTPYVVVPIAGQGASTVVMSSLPTYMSSDQRLSAYGAISGGVTLSKQFARGVGMELGYEYYTHKGALALGGGGTADYADFHYYVANATLRVNYGQLAKGGSLYNSYGFTDWLDSLFDSEAAANADPHAGHRHGQAAAPAGVMFAHMLDRAGDFMVGYRLMRSTQDSTYLHGSDPVSSAQVAKINNTSMVANSMTMNMHMLDLMYAPTDWLTLMLMPQFVDMEMGMSDAVQMRMVMGAAPNMRNEQSSGGFGDTGGYAMFKLWDGGGHHLHLTQGISAPTGSVDVKAEWQVVDAAPDANVHFGNYPYGMQLGSGTWDYKPSLTYTGQADDWFWGGQLSGTHRLQSENSYGYRLGDVFQGTLWSGYQFSHWLSGTVRGLYTGQGGIVGSQYINSGAASMTMPEYLPTNYGGMFGDVGFGVTATPPFAPLNGHKFSFEWLQPVLTHYQGYQLDRTGSLAATWSYMF